MRVVDYCGDEVWIHETDVEIENGLEHQGFVDIDAKNKEKAIEILKRNGYGFEYFYFETSTYVHMIRRPKGEEIRDDEY